MGQYKTMCIYFLPRPLLQATELFHKQTMKEIRWLSFWLVKYLVNSWMFYNQIWMSFQLGFSNTVLSRKAGLSPTGT